jgi:Cft2 family RNA processing exonuclease
VTLRQWGGSKFTDGKVVNVEMSNFSEQVYSNEQDYLACFPLGCGHSQEGVSLIVQLGNHRIMLDCGVDNLEALESGSVEPPDLVFCTHAHLDHVQGLLAFHQCFPSVPIFASEVTTKLLPLYWPDSSLNFCQSLKWRSPLKISDNLTIEIYPAGHLPGAALILLTYTSEQQSYKFVYTGDFSLSNFQLVEGLSLDELRGLEPDVLIIEGTNGTARHPHRRHQEKQLMERINQALVDGQNVILPVPMFGIGQEILKLLRTHHQFTGRDLDIWVDGQIVSGCDLYLKLLPQFPASVQNFAQHQSLFWDEKICPRMRRLSEQIYNSPSSPFILITDDEVDLTKYWSLSHHPWLILVAEHPRSMVNLHFMEDREDINIETYLLSEHSDGRNTTQLIHNLRPQHILFVHGFPNYLADLTNLEELQNRYQLHLPDNGYLVELPVGEAFVHSLPSPPAYYEGEINEQETLISINLSNFITQDPRWTKFADTGLVEARWQGEELVIKGISQRELLRQNNSSRLITDLDCCGKCRHQKNQRCWNQNSPLYGFRVTSDGYCPVFEAQ